MSTIISATRMEVWPRIFVPPSCINVTRRQYESACLLPQLAAPQLAGIEHSSYESAHCREGNFRSHVYYPASRDSKALKAHKASCDKPSTIDTPPIIEDNPHDATSLQLDPRRQAEITKLQRLESGKYLAGVIARTLPARHRRADGRGMGISRVDLPPQSRWYDDDYDAFLMVTGEFVKYIFFRIREGLG